MNESPFSVQGGKWQVSRPVPFEIRLFRADMQKLLSGADLDVKMHVHVSFIPKAISPPYVKLYKSKSTSISHLMERHSLSTVALSTLSSREEEYF